MLLHGLLYCLWKRLSVLRHTVCLLRRTILSGLRSAMCLFCSDNKLGGDVCLQIVVFCVIVQTVFAKYYKRITLTIELDVLYARTPVKDL